MSLINTRRKPLSNNTDFNTGKTFNNTSTSKNSSESRNIEFVANKSKTIDNNINTELPSSSSPNVPKNGVNFMRMNRSSTCSTLEDTEKKKLSSQISVKKNNRKGKKNANDMKIKGENSFLGDPSTKHEKECFVNHNEPKKNSVVGPPRKGIRPVERERMRDWLCRHLNAASIPGLYWLEKKKLIFRIPWKHGSSQNWTEDDAELFVEWAKHTGRYYPDTDKGKGKLNTKRFKATFRCALNSLPDCQELSKLNNKAGSNAFKVYQFSCDKDTCPYKKKKSGKGTAVCCDKSVECNEGDTASIVESSDTCTEDQTSNQCNPEKTSDTCDSNETTPPSQENPPKLNQDESHSVLPESSDNCTPCQISDPNPSQSNSSFDDLSISENDVANTLLELQRGAVSKLLKEKEMSQSQPQVIQNPLQSQMLPVAQLPVSHILPSQMSVPPQSPAQIYSQPVLRSQIAKPVLQPQMQSVQVLQSQLTTHREIHPTQSITYEQTSTMTVAHPVPSTMPSVFPLVPAVVLPYNPPPSHSEPQMAKVCMIPAIVSSTATQMMNIHSNSFDSPTPQLVPVAAPRLSAAPFNTPASLSEAPVFSIKQEVIDTDYTPSEINNNSSNNNNNNIAVKLENVVTGDVTPNYKASEPEPRKEVMGSTTVTGGNNFETNAQSSNRKRAKEKKLTSGSLQGTITRVPITGSAQNYLKKRKK